MSHLVLWEPKEPSRETNFTYVALLKSYIGLGTVIVWTKSECKVTQLYVRKTLTDDGDNDDDDDKDGGGDDDDNDDNDG